MSRPLMRQMAIDGVSGLTILGRHGSTFCFSTSSRVELCLETGEEEEGEVGWEWKT